MSGVPEKSGGEMGGASHYNPNRLRPSELALLRRLRRVPFTDEDCIKVATATMDAIENGKNHRTRLAGVKAFTSLESLNLKEAELAMDKSVAAVVPVQVNVVNVAVEELTDEQCAALYHLSKRMSDAERASEDRGPALIENPT